MTKPTRYERKRPDRVMCRLLSIEECARLAGWSKRAGDAGYQRMRRHLRTVDKQVGRMLLVNVAGKGRHARWAVSEGALRALHPAWFDHEHLIAAVEGLKVDVGATNRRVDALSRQTSEHEEILALQSKEIGKLWRKVNGRAA